MGTGKTVCAIAALISLTATGCFLDREGTGPAASCSGTEPCATGLECVDGVCVEPLPDAGPRDAGSDAGPVDAGPDAGPIDAGPDASPIDAGPPDSGPVDAGPPAHCSNGTLDPGVESDIDCGGDCPVSCLGCQTCTEDEDCGPLSCSGGFCQPALTSVSTSDGDVDAYVRPDGAILLARYAARTYPTQFDADSSQVADETGGMAAPADFAPTPCGRSGHLAFAAFAPSGRTVTLACGTDWEAPTVTVSSDALFNSFADGAYGTEGAAGTPGWGAIASYGEFTGRGAAGMCGENTGLRKVGGFAYCDGGGNTFANHLVSYTVGDSGPLVGCGGVECSGPACETEVWVWLAP